MYGMGRALETEDPAAARRYYEHAAAGGYDDAYYALGRLLHDSDPAHTRHYYERGGTARLTCRRMTNLGLLARGHDRAEALRWLGQAASLDDARALYLMGDMYSKDDRSEARRYYERAAEAGHSTPCGCSPS